MTTFFYLLLWSSEVDAATHLPLIRSTMSWLLECGFLGLKILVKEVIPNTSNYSLQHANSLLSHPLKNLYPRRSHFEQRFVSLAARHSERDSTELGKENPRYNWNVAAKVTSIERKMINLDKINYSQKTKFCQGKRTIFKSEMRVCLAVVSQSISSCCLV